MNTSALATWVGIWGGVLATLHALAALGKWLWGLRRPIRVRLSSSASQTQGSNLVTTDFFVTLTNNRPHAMRCMGVYIESRELGPLFGYPVTEQVPPLDALPVRLTFPGLVPATRVRARVLMANGGEYRSKWYGVPGRPLAGELQAAVNPDAMNARPKPAQRAG
jgi:hypothetical protein